MMFNFSRTYSPSKVILRILQEAANGVLAQGEDLCNKNASEIFCRDLVRRLGFEFTP